MPFRKEDLERDNFKFGIHYSDECFPVCPDGFFRSQMMYLVLRGIKRVLGMSLLSFLS
jgi:hypothetical protein